MLNWQESLCVAYLRGMTPSQRKAFLELAKALLYSKDTASAIYLALFRYYQTLDDTGKTALLDWADAFVQEKEREWRGELSAHYSAAEQLRRLRLGKAVSA